MRSKIDDVYRWVLSCCVDVIAVSESWMNATIGDDEFCPPSFDVYRRDRDYQCLNNTLGGGVMLMTSSRFLTSRLDLSQITSEVPAVDVLGVRIACGDGLKCHVYVVYIPPSIAYDEFNLFFELFGAVLCQQKNVKTVLVGDFNAPQYARSTARMTREAGVMNDFAISLV